MAARLPAQETVSQPAQVVDEARTESETVRQAAADTATAEAQAAPRAEPAVDQTEASVPEPVEPPAPPAPLEPAQANEIAPPPTAAPAADRRTDAASRAEPPNSLDEPPAAREILTPVTLTVTPSSVRQGERSCSQSTPRMQAERSSPPCAALPNSGRRSDCVPMETSPGPSWAYAAILRSASMPSPWTYAMRKDGGCGRSPAA